MSLNHDNALDSQLRLLTALADQGNEIAGNAIQLAPHRWAIYGSILMDGNVLVAEYDTAEEARSMLERLPMQPNVSRTVPDGHERRTQRAGQRLVEPHRRG